MLRNKRGRDSERPVHRDEEWPPLATTRESPRIENEDPTQPKINKLIKKKKNPLASRTWPLGHHTTTPAGRVRRPVCEKGTGGCEVLTAEIRGPEATLPTHSQLT